MLKLLRAFFRKNNSQDLVIWDTMSRTKKIFKQLEAHEVKMYSCGPTVYDFAHIGNFRTIILNDLVRRSLKYRGLQVKSVMNITDVDDKMIKKSHEGHLSLHQLAEKFEKIFWDDALKLNILKPDKTPRATENIEGMIKMIESLLKSGHAYKASDGVYFSIASSKNYGKLARIKPQGIRARVENDEYAKEDARDFALWKFYNPSDGAVSWETPFGKGRPGWHIECSVMSMAELGPTIDIHLGGTDLVFPHHTNEIAQSEASTGKQFVRYWIHGAFVLVDDKKMSKSLGNIITLQTLLEKKINPLAFRYLTLGSHYRTPLNFTWQSVGGAETALNKLRNLTNDLPSGGAVLSDYQAKFKSNISDDFDMPKALSLVWDLVKDGKVSPTDKKATLLDFDRILGLSLGVEAEPLPAEIAKLASDRELARTNKDFQLSDKLRAEIQAKGFVVEDTPDGQKVVKS